MIRLRRNLERQEELKLAAAARRHQAALTLRDEARQAADSDRRELMERLASSISAAELQVAAVQTEAAWLRERHLDAVAGELGQAREAQRVVLSERTRSREVFESVYRRTLARREREATRRLQERTDEAFLLRRRYERSLEKS